MDKMFNIIKIIPKQQFLKGAELLKYQSLRSFLSQAYYCEEVWNHRLNSTILQRVNTEDLYLELDQRYQKTKQLNAIDVDIFVNALQDKSYCDELLDIVHKLRLTADTGYTLQSTSHAIIRALLQFGKSEELLNALDDRLNYGLFLDYYSANLLMDTFWKSKLFAHGSRVASQLMLQEELDHPLACNFGLLHCYNYLLNPEGWPELTSPAEPEEEEEEIKIRVKYLRNPYNDEHFDLKDPKEIVGKTLAMISKHKADPLHQSFYILGLALCRKNEEVQKVCENLKEPLYKEILDLVPDDSAIKNIVNELKTDTINVGDLLVNNVKKSSQKTSEKDITDQCQMFEQWEQDRIRALEEQQQRLSTAKRLENIEDIQNALKEKEERLWFFEREEQIDLAIEKKKVYYPKRWFGKKKKPKKIDEGYVPPEVYNKQIEGSHLG